MYRPAAFVVDDTAVLHAAIRTRVFATIAIAREGRVQFAYAPVVLDDTGKLGTFRFHLARGNPIVALADGARLSFSFLEPDAYISPDWYESQAMVPTWNYIAIEASGIARKLKREELRQLLIDLSAAEEEKLLPKKPWTIDKVPEPRIDALLNAIEGFAVPLETLHGKFKLSQDKKAADIGGVIAALEARGDVASIAVAKAMRKPG
ncbi:MAG TPA: FMN-binding negative transcriptional regulator [Rhizomicrobium sp.]|nr:FMN-binding negative transcriptional regulator [Rhizomicrobium sp.]